MDDVAVLRNARAAVELLPKFEVAGAMVVPYSDATLRERGVPEQRRMPFAVRQAFAKRKQQVREDLSTGYGLRFSTEIYGSKRKKTGFHEYLQETCFALTEIFEHLRKAPGVVHTKFAAGHRERRRALRRGVAVDRGGRLPPERRLPGEGRPVVRKQMSTPPKADHPGRPTTNLGWSLEHARGILENGALLLDLIVGRSGWHRNRRVFSCS